MNLQTKRIVLAVISLVFGLAMTAGIIYLYIPIPDITDFSRTAFHIGFGTTPESFAYSNVILLFLSMAILAAIWLDYFLDTQILKK
jgi:hypothetical protein